MKKTLALILAFAMVFSTITVAFAEEPVAEVSAEATALGTIGMLEGTGDGVTAEYTAKELNRLTAAIMILKLKGLYEDALKYEGENNFADVEELKWAEGKKVLAYVKDNPVGFGGNEKGEFNPYDTLSEQMLYKVLLENLGYKQTTAEIADGDFAWAETLEFAEKLGLKPAKAEKFTVDGLAKAVVGALKTNMKDGKAWVDVLVENGKIEKDKAVAANLMPDAVTTTDAKLKAVKAIANDKVEVEFDVEVEKAFAENAANYNIVVKGSTTALEVKAAVLQNAKKAVLETAVQTKGKAYTLTVGELSINFAGLGVDKAAPTVKSVKCVDTNTVEVEFDKVLDKASAETIENYTLNNNATVHVAALSSSRKVVTLTTEGIAKNKVYSLKIQDIQSSDLVALKTVTKSFTGTADTKAPELKSAVAVNNQRIKVVFTDEHGVDKEAAETIENYNISGLAITNAEAKDVDEDDYYETVELTTDSMQSNKTYKLEVVNMVDGSVSANTTTKTLYKNFAGKPEDKKAPTIKSAYAKGDSKIEVTYTEINRLDVASATNVDNYTINNDITVKSAIIVDDSDLDEPFGKTVLLTIDAMDSKKSYKLTVNNVSDEFGNTIKENTTVTVAGDKKEDLTPPFVKSVKWVNSTSVKLEFDDRVDKASATDPTNYVLNRDLGAALKASLSSKDFKTVTLTTPKLDDNKTYKITINNVKDINDNVMANVVVSFVAGKLEADTERPEIVSVEAVNKDELRVTFDEKVVATSSAITTLKEDGVTSGPIFNQVVGGKIIDDGTTVVYKRTGTIKNNEEYTVDTLTNVKDKSNNNYVLPEDKPTFVGTEIDNDGPEIATIEQTNVKTIRVVFSEPVLVPATISSDKNSFSVHLNPDAGTDNEAYSTVDLEAGSVLKVNVLHKFDFTTSGITDYVGGSPIDEGEDTAGTVKTEFETYLEDKDGPIVEYVEAIDNRTIRVVYNEDLDENKVGSYKILSDDEKTTKDSSVTAVIDPDDSNVARLTTSITLSSNEVYKLKQIAKAYDIAGNSADSFDPISFVGSSIVVADYIKGVEIIDAKTIKVRISSEAAGTTTISVVKKDVPSVELSTKATIAATGATLPADTFTFDLNKALEYDVDYTLAVSGYGSYQFKGVAEDGGLDYTGKNADNDEVITFSGMNKDDYVVNVVYVNGSGVPNVKDITSTFTVNVGFAPKAALDAMNVRADIDVFVVEITRNDGGAVIYSKEFTRK